MTELDFLTEYDLHVERQLLVGEIGVSRRPDEALSCHGLGSCVGVGILDVEQRIAGLAHVQLPYSVDGIQTSEAAADVAVPLLLSRFQRLGGRAEDSVVVLAGGRKDCIMDLGEKNAAAVRAALPDPWRARIALDRTGQDDWVTLKVAAGRSLAHIRTASQALVYDDRMWRACR